MSLERFIRFEDERGEFLYGEVSLSDLDGSLEGKTVTVLMGEPFTGLSKSRNTSVVKKVIIPTPIPPDIANRS